VRSFARRALKVLRTEFASGIPSNTVLMGHEWASIPVVSEFAGLNLRTIFSLHSLETQRSSMTSALSQEILKIEIAGLRAASTVLIQKDAAAAQAISALPECGAKLVYAHHPFSTRPIVADLDPGSIKAKYTIGPVDPTVLFIGDLDDRHGPDVLMKAVPQILKNNKQARFIFVGDGLLQWPLRVHARYLLLEHAVRIVGHVGGNDLFDLIQAADVIAVPSRSRTEEWPILAAWAAKRPVLSTQAMIGTLLKHEDNSVVAYANENSMVWGVERLLFDEGLRKKVAENGHRTLEARFGWNCAAEQLRGLLGTEVK
jgi:glycosyltransferase involved in cell wall biosynthesis